MKKCIYWFCIIFYSSIALASNNAIHLGGNYSFYNSEKLSNFDITPKGAGYHFIFSQNYSQIGIEFSYRQDNLKADVRYDHMDTKLSLKMTSLGFGVYLALVKDVLFRGGVAWYKTKGSVGNTVSELQKHAMKEAWGVSENEKNTGYYLGIQYKIFSSRSIDLYTSYTYQKISDEISNHALGLGLTFKFDLQL